MSGRTVLLCAGILFITISLGLFVAIFTVGLDSLQGAETWKLVTCVALYSGFVCSGVVIISVRHFFLKDRCAEDELKELCIDIGLPENASLLEAVNHVREQLRQNLIFKLGLSPDATWLEIHEAQTR
tara:strand:- start:4441 stop:4821 length:381 start_codon:yes stop_codon:yes gene_type:complete